MGTIVNKKNFKVDIEGKEVEFAAFRPNNDVSTKAQLKHAAAFNEALSNKLLTRDKLVQHMIEQELWDDEREKELDDLRDSLLKNERALKRGGIKKSAARTLALQMRIARMRMQALLMDRNRKDGFTAEAFAENMRFNYLVSACTKYADTGDLYFKSFDDYTSKPSDDPVKQKAAEVLANMIYGVDENFEAQLPENKFLREFNFVNKDLHLIDKEGNLIDMLGRRVDEQGRLVDPVTGKLIDGEGNPLTEEGEYDFETKPFLDDDEEDAKPAEGDAPAPETQTEPVQPGEAASDQKHEDLIAK
jgi:hypothetical protein